MTFPSPGADWPKIDAYLKGLGIRIDAPTFGETEGGNHVAGSEHYQHRARDYPTSSCDAPAVARALQPLAHGPGYVIDELFFSPLAIWYDSGTAYVPSATAIERVNHYNHCHAGCIRGAVFPGTPQPQPTPPQPQPQPVPQPAKRSDPMFVVKGHLDPAIFTTNFVVKEWVENPTLLNVALVVSENHKVDTIDQGFVDSLPLAGITPPNYNGQYVDRH